jgi:hypothetical protein
MLIQDFMKYLYVFIAIRLPLAVCSQPVDLGAISFMTGFPFQPEH